MENRENVQAQGIFKLLKIETHHELNYNSQVNSEQYS